MHELKESDADLNSCIAKLNLKNKFSVHFCLDTEQNTKTIKSTSLIEKLIA